MPNGQQFNPLATLASSARVMGEQANTAIKSLGDAFSQSTSQLLSTAAQAVPPLPGAPGGQQGNPNRGNPGPQAQLPSLIPTQALRAFSQVEEIVLPKGLPRPSAALLQAAGVQPAPAAAREPAPTPPAPPPPTAVSRIPERRGI